MARHGHAHVAAWEYECCGAPLRLRDQVTVRPWVFERQSDLSWDAPRPVEWYAGHHGDDEAVDATNATVLRIWEIWDRVGGDTLELFETWRTAPFAGSESAEIVDRPGYVGDENQHVGWILEIDIADSP